MKGAHPLRDTLKEIEKEPTAALTQVTHFNQRTALVRIKIPFTSPLPRLKSRQISRDVDNILFAQLTC